MARAEYRIIELEGTDCFRSRSVSLSYVKDTSEILWNGTEPKVTEKIGKRISWMF